MPRTAGLKSRDVSILVALILGSSLLVLNPLVVGLFLDQFAEQRVLPFLLIFDTAVFFNLVLSILHSRLGRWPLQAAYLVGLLALPVLMVGSELLLTYHRLTAKNESHAGGLHETDPDRGWRLAANVSVPDVSPGNYEAVYHIDRHGRRAIPQDPGVRRTIHVFGDSFIFGQGVDNEDTALQLLADELRGKFNVLNYGTKGYGLGQMLLSLRAALGGVRAGDVVVFAPIPDDVNRNFIHKLHYCSYLFKHDVPSLPLLRGDRWEKVDVGEQCGAVETLLLNSFGPIGWAYQRWHEREIYDDLLRNADYIFSRAASLVEQSDAQFLVIFLVSPLECGEGRFQVDITNLRTRYRSLLPYCPEDRESIAKLHFANDYHWSPEGNQWAAEALEQVLESVIANGSGRRLMTDGP